MSVDSDASVHLIRKHTTPTSHSGPNYGLLFKILLLLGNGILGFIIFQSYLMYNAEYNRIKTELYHIQRQSKMIQQEAIELNRQKLEVRDSIKQNKDILKDLEEYLREYKAEEYLRMKTILEEEDMYINAGGASNRRKNEHYEEKIWPSITNDQLPRLDLLEI